MIEKVAGRIKGRELVFAKDDCYELILEIAGITCIRDCVNVRLTLKCYLITVESKQSRVRLDGMEYPTYAIVSLYNSLIREELKKVLRHFGISTFSYEVEKVTSFS